MKNIFIKKILFLVLLMIGIFYIGYQIFNSNRSKIVTESAVYTTINDSMNLKGYIIRDETLIYNENSGVINYNIDDGDKVSKGGEVAYLYNTSEDALTKKEMEKVDLEIARLNNIKKMSGTVTTNPNAINSQVYSSLRAMIDDVNTATYSQLDDDRSSILYLINQRNAMMGKNDDIDIRISELNNKKAQLNSKYNEKISTIISPKSGYFSSKIDGMEGTIKFEDALSIKPDDLPKETEIVRESDPNIVGKVIGGIYWYIGCVIKNEDILKLKIGQTLDVSMPFAGIDKIPCTVAAINNTQGNNSDASLILKCNYINKELMLLRDETICLNVSSYSGILISKKSLHEDVLTREVEDEEGNVKLESQKVQGVYVLYGSEAVFKQVIPLYANNSSIICKENPSKEELFTGETIKVYDEVISEGVGLYDGKIVK